MSVRLVALDEANDRIVAQMQESTATFANIEQCLGEARGSADSNFVEMTSNLVASIQQIRDDATHQQQQHHEQIQQLRKMFSHLSSNLSPLPTTTATILALSQAPPPLTTVPQAGTEPVVTNDVTGSWASIHATLPP